VINCRPKNQGSIQDLSLGVGVEFKHTKFLKCHYMSLSWGDMFLSFGFEWDATGTLSLANKHVAANDDTT